MYELKSAGEKNQSFTITLTSRGNGAAGKSLTTDLRAVGLKPRGGDRFFSESYFQRCSHKNIGVESLA